MGRGGGEVGVWGEEGGVIGWRFPWSIFKLF